MIVDWDKSDWVVAIGLLLFVLFVVAMGNH